MLRINRYIENTKVEGPGVRFCIWVQGCHNGCKNCFATEMIDPQKGMLIETKTLIDLIIANKDSIEGVTFLGGEPFEQAGELAEIAKSVKKSGLSVITFTGCTYEELISANNSDYNALIDNTDLLIDGRFDENLLDYSRPLVGSANQRFIFLTDRYSEEDINKLHNAFEIRTDNNGKIVINGMGDLKKLKNAFKNYM